MKKHKNSRRFIIWITALVLLVSTGTLAYADSYHDVRDGEISFYLPDRWESEEIDPSESEGLPYEEIIYAYDDTWPSTLEMQVFFMADDSQGEEFFYLDESEAVAMDYYEKYGKAALETLYGNLEAIGDMTIGQPAYFEGEWNSFIKVPVTGTYIPEGETEAVPLQDVIYLGVEIPEIGEPMVHQILMFFFADGTVIDGNAAKTVEGVVNEFYDYGYADIMAGVSDGSSDSDWGDDSEGGFDSDILIGLISMVGTLAGVLAAGIVIARKLRNRLRREGIDLPKKQRKSRKKEERQAHDHIQQTIRANEINRRDGRRTSDAEARYFQSLETLRKSGLLTREEMRDMLERHERSNRWNRKR